MKRRPAVLVFAALLAVAVRAASPAGLPPMDLTEITSPAGSEATSAALTAGAGGTVWLSWIDQGNKKDGHALRVASFDPAVGTWRPPQVVYHGPDLNVVWADSPALSAGTAGHLAAAWSVKDAHDPEIHRVLFSTSTDAGATWTAPAPLSRESSVVDLASLTTLADGRVLAAWLDGRGGKKGDRGARLFTRFIDPAHVNDPDVLLDSLVSEACPVAGAAFPDGGAILAYRGRTDDEIRDIHIVRRREDKWAEDHALNHDVWTTNHAPLNGPRLAVDGGRLAATWFTGADNDPRVLVSMSPDAGARFLMPLHTDNGHPIGRPDVVLLHDGAAIVVWLEAVSAERKAAPGGAWLRRITPDFTMDPPQILAPASDGRIVGYPRAALLRDYAGGKTAAQLLVSFVAEGSATPLHTVLVNVPEGELLAARESNCNCSPTPEQLTGYPLRGAIETIVSASGAIAVKHPELAGLLPAGTHTFRATPEVLAAAPAGKQILARIERRQGEWWIFDVRLLADVPPPAPRKKTGQ